MPCEHLGLHPDLIKMELSENYGMNKSTKLKLAVQSFSPIYGIDLAHQDQSSKDNDLIESDDEDILAKRKREKANSERKNFLNEKKKENEEFVRTIYNMKVIKNEDVK